MDHDQEGRHSDTEHIGKVKSFMETRDSKSKADNKIISINEHDNLNDIIEKEYPDFVVKQILVSNNTMHILFEINSKYASYVKPNSSYGLYT